MLRGRGASSDARVIAVVRYLKPQYSIFEISNIFQVILASPRGV